MSKPETKASPPGPYTERLAEIVYYLIIGGLIGVAFSVVFVILHTISLLLGGP